MGELVLWPCQPAMASFSTNHGVDRIEQRTKLAPEQVIEVIRRFAAIDIGDEPGTARKHWLFYSPADNKCFVAIRDEITREIITVLPLNYHDKLAWPIKAGEQKKARKLVARRIADGVLALPPPPAEPTLPSVEKAPPRFWFRVKLEFADGRFECIGINGDWPESRFNGGIDEFASSETVRAELAVRLRRCHVNLNAIARIDARDCGRKAVRVPVTAILTAVRR